MFLDEFDNVHVCAKTAAGRLVGRLLPFYLSSAFAMCLVCYFRCFLEKTVTSGMFYLLCSPLCPYETMTVWVLLDNTPVLSQVVYIPLLVSDLHAE